ncbi:MAG: serine hydrolase domain-containing protein [Solirubrobacteraceae bacterium]
MIHGQCDRRFEPVREALTENFRSHGEIGAAVAVMLDGQSVVDLWAGWMDRARTRPWHEDTLVDVFSVGKPMAVLCLLMLVQEGAVDLDAPVAEYWPAFAAQGKASVTVRMLLGHRAGLPAVRRELPELAMYDWELMTSALAAEAPWWEPGTAHGYHTNTYGFLVGELVRRLSGETVGRFFHRRVAEPLGVDFWFGLPESEDERVAEFVFPEAPPELASAAPLMVRRAYFNPPGVSGIGTVNTRAWRAAEMPSTNGHATARAVARIYAALDYLLRPQTITEATTEVSYGADQVLHRPSRFGLGFQLTQPERPLGPGQRGFGHFGAGGSLGFADPDAGITFAYTPNQGEGPRWQNPRNRGLIRAVYESLAP